MTKSSLTVVALAALFALPATAQQQARVVPIQANIRDGNWYTQFPFVYDHFRFQMVLSGSSFCTSSASIGAIAFRRDAQVNEVEPAKTLGMFEVEIAHAATTPSTMSTTFAANRAAAPTTVYSAPLNLPMQIPAPPYSSGPFNIVIPFSSPFSYQLVSGDLCIDLVGPGVATTRDEYFIDGEIKSDNGRYTVFGTAGTFGSGESTTFEIDTFTHPLALLTPGGMLTTQVYGMASAYPTLFVYGIHSTAFAGGPLPFDCGLIGAPGNTIYTSFEAFSPVQMPFNGGGVFGSFFQVPIPNLAPLAGSSVFHQTASYDPTANSLGLVLSQGMVITLGGNPGNAEVNMMGGPDSSSMQGGFIVPMTGSTAGGPVTQLFGTFN